MRETHRSASRITRRRRRPCRLTGCARLPYGVSGWFGAPRQDAPPGRLYVTAAGLFPLNSVRSCAFLACPLRLLGGLLSGFWGSLMQRHICCDIVSGSLAFGLAPRQALWQCPPRLPSGHHARRFNGALLFSWAPVAAPKSRTGCRSSVVEHSLGKGEVESSIPSGSTISCHPKSYVNLVHVAAQRYLSARGAARAVGTCVPQ